MMSTILLILFGALIGMIITSVIYTVLLERMSNNIVEQIKNAKSKN